MPTKPEGSTRARRFFSVFHENTFAALFNIQPDDPHTQLASMVGCAVEVATRFLKSGRVDKRKADYKNLMKLHDEFMSVSARYQDALNSYHESITQKSRG